MRQLASTDAQKRARDKWLSEKVETINLRVPKGKKAIIRQFAEERGESVNALLNRAIDKAMSEEAGGQGGQ